MAITDLDDVRGSLLKMLQEKLSNDEFRDIARTIAGTIPNKQSDIYRHSKLKFGVYKEFSSKEYPTATVVVREAVREESDPMHPNPKSGAQRGFLVEAGGKSSHFITNSVVACERARRMHAKMVRALVKDEYAQKRREIEKKQREIEKKQKANPNFGLF